MRIVLILAMALSTVGTAVAGPREDFRAAKAARDRDDYMTALRLYRSAADQGSVEAQVELGEIYFRGQMRVPYDYAEATKWMLRAAEQGHAMSQRNVGMAYTFGQGVPKNQVVGLMWLNLSVANGHHDAAEDRDDAAKDMTPAQVAEAKKLADSWKPKR
jgi:TPR repeat protein